jgi:hypothetical protein
MVNWFAVVCAHGGAPVEVDPRVELLQAVFRASGSEEFQITSAEYDRALQELLAGHLGHPAVRSARELRWRYGVGYNAPAALALRLVDGEADLQPFPPELDERWAHPRPVRRWLRQVDRLSEEIGWDTFFAAQRPAFAELERAWAEQLVQEDLQGWFAATFGEEPALYVHPSPSSGGNNFGAVVARADGTLERHAVMGMAGGGLHLDIVAHEIAHSYVHPVADEHAELLAAGQAVMGVLGETMAAQAYGKPSIVANETLVRGVVQLYLRDRHPERVISDLGTNEGQSFFWIEEVAEVLQRARSGPQSPLDLAAAAPEVARTLQAWAAKPAEQRQPPFRGPVNGTMTRLSVLITPDTGPLTDYAAQIHGQFHARRGVALAQASAVPSLPPGGVAAYGSPQSNPWVAQIAELARWSIQPDGIAVDGRWFPGEHLLLIACWPHPDDPKAALVVYAGASDGDVVGANSVFHGPHDWLVARKTSGGFEVVEQGNFEKSERGWSLPPRPLVDPVSVGLDPDALDRWLVRGMESRSDALILWVDGQTVVRWPEVQQPIETMSVTKSIVSLGIGQLVAAGRIPSVEEPASRWIGAWKRGDHAPITLRMLLEHTSGLAPLTSREIYAAPDIVALAAAQPLVSRPGEAWAYNNSAANLVTAIGTAAAGIPFDAWVQQHLLSPLGIDPRPWATDPAGHVHGGAGLALTADDLLRIGQMMLDEGRWGEQQLVPAEWIRTSTAPNGTVDYFGRQWWPVWEEGRVVGFRADGWLGQVLMVLPEQRLVAIRQMRGTEAHWKSGDQGVDTYRDFQERVLELR